MAENEGGGTTTSIEALESLEAIIEKKKEQLKIQQQEAAVLEDTSEQLRLQSELNEEILRGLAKQLEKKGAIDNLTKEAKGQLQAQLNLTEKQLQAILDSNDAQKQILKSLAKRRALEKDIRDTSRETDNFVAGIAGKLGIAASLGDTATGKFIKMADGLESSGKGGELLAASFFRTFNILNVSLAVLSKIGESVMAVAFAADQAASNFQRTTGFAGEIQMDLAAIAQAGVASGVTLEDAGKAMGALANNFSAFNPTATQTNIQLAETITLLEKTGVSADQSAKTMDFFNRVMGASPEASANMAQQLALAGTNIGITTSKMLSDFESVNGYLIGFGDRTTEVFLELQAQAKATGVAIGTLVSIAQKFDQFDTAAKAVGSLNAALGTNLSSVDMINASTEERISMLAQEIDFAAGGFENLDRFTQMYVAQTIGAKDAAEAQRILSLQRNPAALAEFNAKMEEQQARQQNLNDLTERFVPVLEQFKIAVLGLGLALEPVISTLTIVFNVFGSLVGFFVKALNVFPGLAEAIGFVVGSLTGLLVIGKVVGFFKALTAAMKTQGFFAKLLTGQNLLLGASQTTQSAAQKEQAASNSVTAPIIDASSTKLSAGFIKLAPALGIAALAAVAISAAMYGLAAAFQMVVPSAILLFDYLIQNLDFIPELAFNLYLLGPAFLAFGAGILIGAQALAVATPFLLIANIGLSGMVNSVTLLGEGFKSMGLGITMTANGIGSVVSGLAQIKELTDDSSFFAITTDGSKTSMVSAKGGEITNFSSENITVDVKIPEIKIPTPIVNVYIGNEELRNFIQEVTDGG